MGAFGVDVQFLCVAEPPSSPSTWNTEKRCDLKYLFIPIMHCKTNTRVTVAL